MTDPRKLKPSELCRFLNSTPLGEVADETTIRRHRSRAGLNIGDSKYVDLIRYGAWLVRQRHAPKPKNELPLVDVAEAADGAAALGRQKKNAKLTSKQEATISALLAEQTHKAAAEKAGVSETTLYRWLNEPAFRNAYRQARREMIEFTIGRMQAATGQAVETLISVARQGRRDGDRLRAAVAILEQARAGLADADLLHGPHEAADGKLMNSSDVVTLLGNRLREINQSELTTTEKARLTASLADALLRAIGVDVLDKRLEALQDVLLSRKEKQ